MRFAIVGCGVIGRLHARVITSLQPRAQLVVVADSTRNRAHELAAQHCVDASTTIADVLCRSDVDAVAVCTPSGQHAETAVAALQAGKHVIIEKPLDIDLSAAQRVLEAERHTPGTAMVISQHRHDPASRVVHEAITADRFGRLTSGAATIPWWRSDGYYDSAVWRGTKAVDGGVFMNQGIHTIDLLSWFLGDAVETFAWADRLTHSQIEVEDTGVAAVRFASGALAVIDATTAAYPGLDSRLQVHGDLGSAVIEGNQLVYFHAGSDSPVGSDYGADGLNQAHRLLSHTVDGEPDEPLTAGLSSAAHRVQYEDFLDAVQQGRQPLVTVDTATRTLTLIRGIYESARTGARINLTELSG